MDRYVFLGSARDVNGLSAEHLKPEWAQNQLRVSTFNFKLATAFHRAASDAPTDSCGDLSPTKKPRLIIRRGFFVGFDMVPERGIEPRTY